LARSGQVGQGKTRLGKVRFGKVWISLIHLMLTLTKGELFDINYKQGGLEVSRGNLKLDDCTLIINMGPAETCPSKQLGFCRVEGRCYAAKAERLYKNVLPYRTRQYNYWRNTAENEIAVHFDRLLKRIRVPIRFLRFNESGDFFSQADVTKLSNLARYLKEFKNITTYGYTARHDLDFSNVHFLVKGSSHDSGNNGKTMVMPKKEIESHLSTLSTRERKKWMVCPMSCKKCHLCKKKTGVNIIFPLH